MNVLQRFTRDGDIALTALVVRRLEQEVTDVGTARILAAERRVVTTRFGDELRRLELEARPVPRPGLATVRRYLETHGSLRARRVEVSPAPSWLPEGSGYALASSAPASLFTVPTGRSVRLTTIEGPVTVRAVEDTTVLEALPLTLVCQAIVRELEYEQRSTAYDDWALRQQHGPESRLVCQKDRLPEIAVVSLSSLVPFLALHEAAAASG